MSKASQYGPQYLHLHFSSGSLHIEETCGQPATMAEPEVANEVDPTLARPDLLFNIEVATPSFSHGHVCESLA